MLSCDSSCCSKQWVHVRIDVVLMSTHILCFRAKIRKYCIPHKAQFYYVKLGCKGVLVTWTCKHDFNHAQDPDIIIFSSPEPKAHM